MGIQLPGVDRVGPQAPSPTQIYEQKVPNPVEGEALIQKSVSTAVEQVNDYQQKVEANAIETTSTKMTNDWEIRYRKRLAEIGQMDGDTRPHYAELDKQQAEWVNEVKGQYPDADARLIKAYEDKVAHRSLGLRDKQATQAGSQYQKWTNDVEEANTEIIAQRMFDSIEVTNDPKWKDKLDTVYDELLANQVKLAGNNAQLVEKVDPATGQTYKTLSPDASMKMLKSTSSVLRSTVEVLENTGRTEDAKYVMDKYGEHITVKDKQAILTKRKENEINLKAATAVNVAMRDAKNNGDPKLISDAIDKATAGNPQVNLKAASDYGTYLTKQKQVQEAQDKNIINTASNYAQKMKFADESEMMADPKMSAYMNKLKDPKDRKAVIQNTFMPVSTSPETFNRVSKIIEDGNIGELDEADLTKTLIGANPAYRKYAERIWKDARTTDSQEISKTQTVMFKKLRRIIDADTKTKALGVKTYKHKPTPAEEAKWQEALTEYVQQFPTNAKFYQNPQDAEQLVQDFVSDYKKTNAFGKPAQETVSKYTWGSKKALQKTETPQNGPLGTLSPAAVKAWGKYFVHETKHVYNPSKGDNMDDFRRKYGDKLPPEYLGQ